MFVNTDIEDLDTTLQQQLEQIFKFPSVESVSNPTKSDVVLDVYIAQYTLGGAMVFSLGQVDMPLLKRPTIVIKTKLYKLISQQTITVFEVQQSLPFKATFRRLLSFRGLFSVKPDVFDQNDLNRLLYQACHSVLVQVKAAL